MAISNPLIDDYTLKGAKGLLVNITGGKDLKLFEVEEAVNKVRAEVDSEAELIIGSITDNALEGKMRVSIVATSLDGISPEEKSVVSMVHRIHNRNSGYSNPAINPNATSTVSNEGVLNSTPIYGANALQPDQDLERANVPVHISHIKCLGVDVWKQSDSIIKIVETAQQKDIDITANQYPYDASATSLKAAVVPRWAESGGSDSLFIRFQNPALRSKILGETQRNITRRGGADKLLVIQAPDTTLVGKNVLKIAEDLGKSPENAVFDILKTGYIKIASFNMNSYDIENFMVQPWVVTGSDGGSGHPRKYGTFPYKYRKFVKNI